MHIVIPRTTAGLSFGSVYLNLLAVGDRDAAGESQYYRCAACALTREEGALESHVVLRSDALFL